MKKKNFGKVIMSLIIAMAIFIGLIFIEGRILTPNGSTDVIIATKDIDKGVIITKENVSEYFKEKENVDGELQVTDSVKTLDELIGSKVKTDIFKGGVISKNNITSLQDLFVDMDEVVEVSIKVDDFSQMVGGTIREGDEIDITLIDNVSLEVDKVLSNVFVSSVFSMDGTKIERNSPTSATVITLLLSKEDEEKLHSVIQDKTVRVSKYK